MLNKWQKKITDTFMRTMIEKHVNNRYFKKGLQPETEQVMQDIDDNALNVLMQHGYTREEIAMTVSEVLAKKLSGAKTHELNA